MKIKTKCVGYLPFRPSLFVPSWPQDVGCAPSSLYFPRITPPLPKSQQGYQGGQLVRCKHISKGCLKALPLAHSTHTSHCRLLFTVWSSAAAHLTSQALVFSLCKREMFLLCILAMFVKLITKHLVHNSCSINKRWDSCLIIGVAIIIGDDDGVFIGPFISLSTLQIPISRTSFFILLCLCVQGTVTSRERYWEINWTY